MLSADLRRLWHLQIEGNFANDHRGKKVHFKCDAGDTTGNLKLIIAQTDTHGNKIVPKNWRKILDNCFYKVTNGVNASPALVSSPTEMDACL